MKTLTKTLFIVLIVFCFISYGKNAFAQGVSLSTLVSLPSGDFGDDDIEDEDAGLAKTGFGVDLSIDIPMNTENLYIHINASAIYNPIDVDELTEVFQNQSSDWTYTTNDPYSMSFPIMGGIKYYQPLSETSKFYFQGELGLNINSMSEIEVEGKEKDFYQGDDKKSIRSYDHEVATAFGIGVGGGFLINEKLRLGLKYLDLGKHEIERDYNYKYYYNGSLETDETEKQELEKKISMVTLSIGICF